MKSISAEQFINCCQQSSQNAYEAFKQLLNDLDNPNSRKNAFQLLLQICDFYQSNKPDKAHFHYLQQSVLDQNHRAVELKLLQFPSTFLPEAWSFTFYEGLIRYPLNEYQNKTVVELGCGIGWISIALAKRYLPESIIGVDINPKAIICARLNLYLNALNEDGSERILDNGKSLLQIVSFFESDLFSYFEGQSLTMDKIIGCIPQVLNPEPAVMENLIAESASDEYLQSLSNYSAKQGYIEDQFGLGLIASAVEQSVPLLKTSGKLILNLGGRPGRAVLERLMRRRGFEVRRVWQTQVEQAADTEIDALVDIEKNTGHRFEFYLSPASDVSVDARTAQLYANAGGKIFHSVDVYQAELLLPEQVKSIYQSVDRLGGKALRSAVDLTFDNFEDAAERYSFLAFLAEKLQQVECFPYEDTAGLVYFRQQLAEYFRYYLHLDLNEKQLVITPGRQDLIHSLLTSYRPALTLVSNNLSHLIAPDFDSQQHQIIKTPPQVEFLLELIGRLKPQIVITQLEAYELQSSQLVAQLVQCAKENQVLLVIDITDSIDLSSQPDIHGVYRYLSQNGLPDNLILTAALVNNRVYQNYSLNIALSSNDKILQHLADSAELSYSRTPILKQLYYAHLLEELLFFQRTRRTNVISETRQPEQLNRELPLGEDAAQAFCHPAITGNHLAFDSKTVRLDFGENELKTPEFLKRALFESYLVRKCSKEDCSPQAALLKQMQSRFGLPANRSNRLVFGNGVSPIYSALLTICAREQQKIVIPSGCYGYFHAAASYKGLGVVPLLTSEQDDFKIQPNQLRKVLQENPGCWLFLNAPIVNPTGAIYTQSELDELLALVAEFDASVIIDTIFSGLEFNTMLSCSLENAIARIGRTSNAKLAIMGGISKEYSAAGLRFGYCWSTSSALLEQLDQALTHKPHFTLGYAIKKLLDAHLTQSPLLIEHLSEQSKILSERASRLGQLLGTKGWRVIKPKGGLFLVAKPASFINSQQLTLTAAGDKVTQLLFEQQNLVINNSTWTGLPGYCRFVLASAQADFDEALKRLERFDLPS